MRLNVIRMDSKGRISIPFFLRNLLELDHGDHLMLKMNGKNEITITPFPNTGISETEGSNKGFSKTRYTCLVGSK